MARVQMSLEECYAHIPQRITPEMEQYANEVVFPRYILTESKGKQQHGYCTYCHASFLTEGLKHLKPAICPSCESKCIVCHRGRRRNGHIDRAYFTYYLKSAIDPEAITAVGVYAVRDFSARYEHVRTLYSEKALYVLKPGGGAAFIRYVCYYGGQIWAYEFGQAASVKCQFNRDHIRNMPHFYSRESIRQAVTGTSYRYSTWEQYSKGDMTEFFDLYSRYPCIEYLTKLGFKHLVEQKLAGENTYGAIHWRGKTLLKVLRLTKQELRVIKRDKLVMDFSALRILNKGRRDGSRLTPQEALEIDKRYFYTHDFLSLLKHGSVRKINNYMVRQTEKFPQHFRNPYEALRDWRDYLYDCERLMLNTTDEAVLFPRNLHQAHQNTIAQIKVKGNVLVTKRIKARLPKLKARYLFIRNGFIIRPAASVQELIAEGKALHHCVGNYAEGYAEGKFEILLIRRLTEPDTPYYTMEVQKNKIIQCRGLKNCQMTDEVRALVDEFITAKLGSPNVRQEVAI